MSNLDNVFNVEESPVATSIMIPEGELNPLSDKGEESELDSAYVRKNQIEFIEISKAAVNTAMRIASESEAPRAIETLALMLKTASEMNRQLVQQHKDKAEVKQMKSGKGVAAISNGGTTNNIIMSGSLADITRMLRDAENAKNANSMIVEG